MDAVTVGVATYKVPKLVREVVKTQYATQY